MKTKGTLTDLRDLKKNLILERNWEEDKDFILKNVPKKDVEIMTNEQKEVVYIKMIDQEIDCKLV